MDEEEEEEDVDDAISVAAVASSPAVKPVVEGAGVLGMLDKDRAFIDVEMVKGRNRGECE